MYNNFTLRKRLTRSMSEFNPEKFMSEISEDIFFELKFFRKQLLKGR